MRSATIWTSPQSPQRRCCAHVRGKTWVGSPAPARASGNASRVQYLAVRCANAGSVRPVIHRPGRLPEGRDAGPSLEPGWRSTVPRTADQPYVSFAQRGAVSEGIQLPALPRCRYVRPCTCCGRYSVGYGDPSAAPPVAWITFHKGHQRQLPLRCPSNTRSDGSRWPIEQGARLELMGARWGFLPNCIEPHRAQSVEVTRLS